MDTQERIELAEKLKSKADEHRHADELYRPYLAALEISHDDLQQAIQELESRLVKQFRPASGGPAAFDAMKYTRNLVDWLNEQMTKLLGPIFKRLTALEGELAEAQKRVATAEKALETLQNHPRVIHFIKEK